MNPIQPGIGMRIHSTPCVISMASPVAGPRSNGYSSLVRLLSVSSTPSRIASSLQSGNRCRALAVARQVQGVRQVQIASRRLAILTTGLCAGIG